jgi:hypothetical protein
MNYKNKLLLLVVFLFVLNLGSSVHAALDMVGPTSPDNHYPLFYRDLATRGTMLNLCLDPNFCVFDPPVAGNTWSQQTGFGGEAFYWSGEAEITSSTGVDALLVMALEAAYALEDPEDGQQIVFSRIRIRATNLPEPGTYTIVHPFGRKNFVVTPDPATGVLEINDTSDIGIGNPGNFNGALRGDVGPFLRAVVPAPPAGFIGNANVLQTITGSPLNTNFFQIIGPAGSNLGGPAGQANTITQDQFALQGRIATVAGLSVDRAVITRDSLGAGSIDVFVTAARGRIRASAPGIPRVLLTKQGTSYFGRLEFTANGPTTVRVVNLNDNPRTVVIENVIDQVTITEATYSNAAGTLTVAAFSSDQGTPAPTLRAVGFTGAFVNGVLTVTGVTIPPTRVTVRSSRGGSARATVTVIP